MPADEQWAGPVGGNTMDSQQGQQFWYAQPLMTGRGMPGAGGVGAMLGASADGRQAFQFKNSMKLELEDMEKQGVELAGGTKNDFDYLLRTFSSRLQSGGPAHAWSQRMQQILPGFYRGLLHQWARQAVMDPRLYAVRLQSIALRLSQADLLVEDVPGASLHELLRQSMAQYFQQNSRLLKLRDAAFAPQPGPMPRFMLQFYMQQHSSGSRATARSRGQASSSAAGQSGVGSRGERGGFGRALGEVAEGGGEGSDGSDDGSEEGQLMHLLPLEQVDLATVPFDRMQRQNGRPHFAPPPTNPPDWPTEEELEELQEQFDDWEYRVPARMTPWVDLPGFSTEDAGSAAALQALASEILAATRKGDIHCPKPSQIIIRAFEGQHLRLTPTEFSMLEHPQPLEEETPEQMGERLKALVDINGGASRWPTRLLVEKYLAALDSYEGPIASKAADLFVNNPGLTVDTVDFRLVTAQAQRAYDAYVLKHKRAPKLKQPKLPKPDQQGPAGKQQGGRTSGNWDNRGSGGYPRGSGRQEQPRGGGYQRHSGHTAMGWEEDYSAHAAQQMEPAPATYHAVPPPRHQLQYGGSSRGPQGGQARDRCVTCGRYHGRICWTERPREAPDTWTGPSTVSEYERYVMNCKADGRYQPLRFKGQLRGIALRKEVAEYLGQVGDRLPKAAPWGDGSRAEAQRQGGGAQGRARGRGRVEGAAAGFMAESAGPQYPDLSATFTKGATLHAAEEEDDTDAALYGYYAESEVSEMAEAMVSTRRSAGEPSGAAASGSQQRGAPAAGQRQGQAASTGSQAQPAATAAQRPDRPPLPAPVAAPRQAPNLPATQAAANATAAAPAPAARSKPPLPFTTIQPAEGTPPNQFPLPMPRHSSSSPAQQAVARGPLMQQLPVSISLQALASTPAVTAEALKRLLSSSSTELAVLQSSPLQLPTANVVVRFSSMMEAARLLTTTQAFAALDVGEWLEAQAGVGEAMVRAEEPQLAQEAAGVAAEVGAEGAEADAKEGEGAAAASTACAAAGHEAAGLQELEVPKAANRRPTTFELLGQTPSTPGITVTLLDSQTGLEDRTLTGSISRFILDSGADVVLMSEDCARRNGLQLLPSNRRICTSSGQVTRTLSRVAQPVQYMLGKGTPQECAVVEDTFVMPGSGSTYDILLGTPLIVKWGLFVDPLTSTATYRPFWHSQGDSRTVAHVPVLTAVDVPASTGAAKASELTQAQPKHELLQPEEQAKGDRAAEAMLQAATQPRQPPAQNAAAGGEADGADAASTPVQALEPAGASTSSDHSNYEPPTSLIIVAA